MLLASMDRTLAVSGRRSRSMYVTLCVVARELHVHRIEPMSEWL